MKPCILLLALSLPVLAQTPPDMPKPAKEHDWLQKFVGEWDIESECDMMGMKVKSKGTETVKSLGGFWIQSEMTSEFLGANVTGCMTVGYDVKKKKYSGTWVCSVDGHLWNYTGEVSADGKVLTLETEGPNMLDPTKTCKMKDVTTFKGDTERVLESWMLGDDGKWVKFMSMTAKKKAKAATR
jgi:hypothetical protein